MRTLSTSPLISERLLQPLRALWVVAARITLVALCLSVPIIYAQGHQLCSHVNWCSGPQLSRVQMRSLHHVGMPLDFYAGYMAALNFGFGLVYCSVAALIFARRSQERMALLSAFFLVVFGGLTFPGTPAALADAYPVLHIPAGLTQLVGATLLGLFFFLFPNGRFVPRWSPWLLPVLPLLQAPDALFPNSAFTLERLPLLVGIVPFFGILLFTVGSQVYRFRKVSTLMERQQTKWVVLGVGLGMVGFLILVFANIALPASFSRSIYSVLVPQTIMYAFMLLIPLSIGLAILRYNLWEADVLINRTLVYASLTLSLGGLYVLGVIGVQALTHIIAGQSSDLAIAVVTLAVAALFNPWRRRLQAFIDRRFYRRKYDAARILAAFSAMLRDEVDLETVKADLVAAAHEAMQPTSLTLWLPETRNLR